MDMEGSEGGSTMADSEGTIADSETQEEDNVSDAENRHEIAVIKCRKCELSFPSLYHLHHHTTIAHRPAIFDTGIHGYNQSVEPLALNLKISNAIAVMNSKSEYRKVDSSYETGLKKDATISGALDLSNTCPSYGALDLSTANMPIKDAKKAKDLKKGDHSLSNKKEKGDAIDYSMPSNLSIRKGEVTPQKIENPGLQGKPHKFFSRYPPPDQKMDKQPLVNTICLKSEQENKEQTLSINLNQIKSQEECKELPKHVEKDAKQLHSYYPVNSGFTTNQNMGIMSSLPYPFNLQQQMLMMNNSQSLPVSGVNSFLSQSHISQMAKMQTNMLGQVQYDQDLSPFGKSNVGPVKPTSASKRSRAKPAGPSETGQKSVLEIYECKVCNRKFSQVGNFHNHMKLHNEKICVCGICRCEFADSYELQRHMRKTHTGDMPYKCDECDREFSQYNNLRRHLRVHSGKSYKCHICGRTFNEVFYLEMHIGSHTGERTYRCGVCNLTFRDNAELQKHVQTHSAAELHTCEVCGKSFSKACVLRQHKKMHSGVRPYKCDICEKAFIHRHHLKIHSRMHSTSKPFQCKVCGKDFAQTSHLYKHIRQHTDISPELAKSIEQEAKKLNSKESKKISPKKKSKQQCETDEHLQITTHATSLCESEKEDESLNKLQHNQSESLVTNTTAVSDIMETSQCEDQTDLQKNIKNIEQDKEIENKRTSSEHGEEQGIEDNIKKSTFAKYYHDDSSGRNSQSESGVGSDDEYSDTERTLCIDEDRDDGDIDSIYSDITVESEKGVINVGDVPKNVEIKVDEEELENSTKFSQEKENSAKLETENCYYLDNITSSKHRGVLSSPSFDSASPASSIGSSLASSLQSEEIKSLDKTSPSMSDGYIQMSDNFHAQDQDHRDLVVSSSTNNTSENDSSFGTCNSNIDNTQSLTSATGFSNTGDVEVDKGRKRLPDNENIHSSSQVGAESPLSHSANKSKQRRRRKKADPPITEQSYYPQMPNVGLEAQQLYMLQLHQMQMALAASMATGHMFPVPGQGGRTMPENFYPGMWNPLNQKTYPFTTDAKEKSEIDPSINSLPYPFHLNSPMSNAYSVSPIHHMSVQSKADSKSCDTTTSYSVEGDSKSRETESNRSKDISGHHALQKSVDSSDFLRSYYRFSGSPVSMKKDVSNYSNLSQPLVSDMGFSN